MTSLEVLHLAGCRRLETLPESITALSRLRKLITTHCLSMSELPSTIFGLMRGFRILATDLVAEWRAIGIGHLTALTRLTVTQCTDEAVRVLDRCGTLKNLNKLGMLDIIYCNLMTKIPESIGLLENLGWFQLWRCEKVRELPNSIGQLRVLKVLCVRECSSLETLPEILGALTSLRQLWIVRCPSMTERLVNTYLVGDRRLRWVEVASRFSQKVGCIVGLTNIGMWQSRGIGCEESIAMPPHLGMHVL